MKNANIVLLLIITLLSTSFAEKILPLQEIEQRKDQWCWAGCSYTILTYYGESVSQGGIVEFAYGDSSINQWNWLYGSSAVEYQGQTYYPKGINLILNNWNTPNNAGYFTLSEAEWKQEIDDGHPFVVRWGWNSGGGHFVVGQGYLDNGNYQIMDPWFGNGYTVNSYNWMKTAQGGQGNWTHSLTTDRTPDNGTKYTLVVENGTGDGSYETGSVVNIAADVLASERFIKWSGGGAAIADSLSETTTITMGTENLSVIAVVEKKEMLTYPNGGEVIELGSTCEITWNAADFNGTISIDLMRHADTYGKHSTIATGVANTGSYSWSVDPSIPLEGNYYISLTCTDGASDLSAAPFTFTETQVTKYEVVVNAGSGDGSYAEGASVTITANEAPAGYRFDHWSGDTDAVTAAFDSVATFTMVGKALAFTANYVQDLGDIDTSKLSEDLVHIAGWDAIADNYGSASSCDTVVENSDTLITAQLFKMKDNDAANEWAWTQVAAYTAESFVDVDLVKVTYSSENPVKVVIGQEKLLNAGVGYYVELPATVSGDTTLYLPIAIFEQPDYTADSLKLPLVMDEISSISFDAVAVEDTTNLKITELRLNGYTETPVPLLGTSSVVKRSVVTQSRSVVLTGFNNGQAVIRVFGLNGRQLFNRTVSLVNGTASISTAGLNSGLFLLQVEQGDASFVQKLILQ